eukprot:TRINITY_DN2355_c0_g1_i6.p1 TRINITY_DN2355_c0_g1~~TRINITY_DN2355_c0_g1_i6.p1  ORF type:complete len:260 (+),score=86.72 TRINITY_DN2355_c0_g1_i6:592-1371(+)
MLPTSTMGPGLMSLRSIHLIGELRKRGVRVVYVTGARRSTIEQRLPLMAAADAAFAETGGRFLDVGCKVLDPAWTARQEAACGPAAAHSRPAAERPGALWDWARLLMRRGYRVDTRSYYFCFRVDLAKQEQGSGREDEAAFKALIDAHLPSSLAVACNLGKWDFFPVTSGKGTAVRHYMHREGFAPGDCVALFDDENDLCMAEACGEGYVLGTTHPAVADAMRRHPEWKQAPGVGPIAAENVLEELLHRVAHNGGGARL